MVLAGTGYFVKKMFATQTTLSHPAKKRTLPSVQTILTKITNYPLFINSSGVVIPHNKTTLVAELAGKIIYLSPHFIEGGYVKKGELLVGTDRTTYVNKIKLAQAELDQQQLQLQEALSQQHLAQKNWDMFGDESLKPTAMAMKKPLVASAKAAIKASQIRLEQAKLEIPRTKIYAPYDGRVESREVSLGQFINQGSTLGKLFSTDFIEVKLPVSNQEYTLLTQKNQTKLNNTVNFFRELSSKKSIHWKGILTRTSPSVDSSTRQISLVATIYQPFKSRSSLHTLNIGEYLQAEITATTLRNVIIIPSFTIDNEQKISLFDNGVLKKRKVTLLHQTAQQSIIASKGFSPKDRLIITPLLNPIEGMKIRDLGSVKKKVK